MYYLHGTFWWLIKTLCVDNEHRESAIWSQAIIIKNINAFEADVRKKYFVNFVDL